MPDALQAALFLMMIMLGTGGMVTMILRARHLYGGGLRRHGLFHETSEGDVRLAALNTYERVAKEKLAVLRRAVDMGWGDPELKALDARLEQLVGKEGIARIASGDLLSKEIETATLTPEQELARLKKEAD